MPPGESTGRHLLRQAYVRGSMDSATLTGLLLIVPFTALYQLKEVRDERNELEPALKQKIESGRQKAAALRQASADYATAVSCVVGGQLGSRSSPEHSRSWLGFFSRSTAVPATPSFDEACHGTAEAGLTTTLHGLSSREKS